MLTSSFAKNVIEPLAFGQPNFVSQPIHFAVQTILLNPRLFDIAFVLIQLGLGALIIWRKTTRYGLIGSVIWGLAAWYIGEGLGGLLGGNALLLTGAPGAALLYAVIALGVMPKGTSSNGDQTSPATWLVFAWAALWLGGIDLQLAYQPNTARGLSSIIAQVGHSAPSWLGEVDLWFIHLINEFGALTIAVLIILQAIVGLGIFLAGYWRLIAVKLGIILAILFWLTGQGLGGFYTGLATDPNSAPLIILLGLAILGSKPVSY